MPEDLHLIYCCAKIMRHKKMQEYPYYSPAPLLKNFTYCKCSLVLGGKEQAMNICSCLDIESEQTSWISMSYQLPSAVAVPNGLWSWPQWKMGVEVKAGKIIVDLQYSMDYSSKRRPGRGQSRAVFAQAVFELHSLSAAVGWSEQIPPLDLLVPRAEASGVQSD